MYHGAALIQIAEDENFTAINSIRVGGQIVRAAYKVNDRIAVYLKHATKPVGRFKEFIFTFTSDHIRTIRALAASNDKTFIALVCVSAREVCLITADQLNVLITERQKAFGGREDQYTILVTAPANKGLRVYVNAPGRKKVMLGKELIISRSAFPAELFV